MYDAANPKRCRRRHVRSAVVDENHFIRVTLQHIEREPVYLRVRLAQADVTRTEKGVDVIRQTEGANAVVVQFASLVVYGGQFEAARLGNLFQYREPGLGQNLGLRRISSKKSSGLKLRGW